jgi:SIT family siderophore-iron:H+ symporter-like MFS transporter
MSKSPGVARVEALAKVMTLGDRIAVFLGVFLIAYAYGLDGTVRGTYQPYATGSFGGEGTGSHSLTSTINIIRAVVGAAVQPSAAKLADVFGRVELVCASVFFYVLGTIVEAVSHDVATFAAGAAIYQIGYTIIIVMVEVIVADFTSTRSRLFFSYVPALPFIINTWVSGSVTSAVLATTSWRWGVAMWCIIYPVCSLPLIGALVITARRSKKQGFLGDEKTIKGATNVVAASSSISRGVKLAKELFWLLDVIGIILVFAMFDLILVPMTLAGGVTGRWDVPQVIAPLVIGVLCIPVFIFWELRAPHPLVPFRLMGDRSVWAAIAIAILLNFAWTMQGDYLYTVLVVAFDFSVSDATRISSLYSFSSTIVGPLLGLLVYKIRRLKYMIVAGTCLFLVAFGLLIRFRGSTGDQDGKVGVIAAQVLLGVAGGMFPYPTQASLQVQLPHEHMAVMTGLYLAVYNVGSALGNAVSGAVWTQTLPAALAANLDDPELVSSAYGDPLSVVPQYPMSTPERMAIVEAYRSTQRLLTITGICLCVPMIAFAMALRNPRLTDKQSLAKEDESRDERTEGRA